MHYACNSHRTLFLEKEFVQSNSLCNHTLCVVIKQIIGLYCMAALFLLNTSNLNWTSLNPITIIPVIKTITKFLNVIGYHQHDLSTNRTVYASCL